MLGEDGTLTPVDWAGSGDVAAVARANVWMVTDPERERYSAGDWMEVLKR
jgi:molybdopterin biosynthesis enzyme